MTKKLFLRSGWVQMDQGLPTYQTSLPSYWLSIQSSTQWHSIPWLRKEAVISKSFCSDQDKDFSTGTSNVCARRKARWEPWPNCRNRLKLACIVVQVLLPLCNPIFSALSWQASLSSAAATTTRRRCAPVWTPTTGRPSLWWSTTAPGACTRPSTPLRAQTSSLPPS